MKYEIHESVVFVYEVEATSIEDALEKAFELTDEDRLYKNTEGFTYIRELETGKDRIL
jgi:hypothetical protein